MTASAKYDGNNRLIVFMGVLSYSLYLWQQPFTNLGCFASDYSQGVRLLLIFAAAFLSYSLVEKPFLRLKERFANSSRILDECGRRVPSRR